MMISVIKNKVQHAEKGINDKIGKIIIWWTW